MAWQQFCSKEKIKTENWGYHCFPHQDLESRDECVTNIPLGVIPPLQIVAQNLTRSFDRDVGRKGLLFVSRDRQRKRKQRICDSAEPIRLISTHLSTTFEEPSFIKFCLSDKQRSLLSFAWRRRIFLWTRTSQITREWGLLSEICLLNYVQLLNCAVAFALWKWKKGSRNSCNDRWVPLYPSMLDSIPAVLLLFMLNSKLKDFHSVLFVRIKRDPPVCGITWFETTKGGQDRVPAFWMTSLRAPGVCVNFSQLCMCWHCIVSIEIREEIWTCAWGIETYVKQFEALSTPSCFFWFNFFTGNRNWEKGQWKPIRSHTKGVDALWAQ